MRIMMLLKSDAQSEAGVVPDDKLFTEMGKYSERMINAGVMLGGEGLLPSSKGTRIRIENGKTTVLDGPFADTRELIAGYSMYRAKTKEEAIEWARRCLQIHMDGTGIDHGEIEVRPVWETEDIPVGADEVPGGWRDREKIQRERLGQA